MKINKYVNVETEIEIDVNVTDFLSSIAETPDSLPTILAALNRIAEILKAIPEKAIFNLNDAQKNTISGFLIRQGRRYGNSKKEEAIKLPPL